MKVAIETTTAISQGLCSPAADRLWSSSREALRRSTTAQRAFTVGTTDMPGPRYTSGDASKTIFTGTR